MLVVDASLDASKIVAPEAVLAAAGRALTELKETNLVRRVLFMSQ
jgi:hypothetical protein